MEQIVQSEVAVAMESLHFAGLEEAFLTEYEPLVRVSFSIYGMQEIVLTTTKPSTKGRV